MDVTLFDAASDVTDDGTFFVHSNRNITMTARCTEGGTFDYNIGVKITADDSDYTTLFSGQGVTDVVHQISGYKLYQVRFRYLNKSQGAVYGTAGMY